MAHTNTDESKKIPLGSGEVYCVEYSGSIPSDASIETEANRLGHITGGASFEYKPTVYTAKDDLNKVHKRIVTDEEATLKLGLITWNTTVLNKLIETGTVTESNGKREFKIGGIENQSHKNYIYRFVNKDAVDGDTRLTVVGANEAGLSIAWAKDKEAAIHPEIKAVPMSDGSLAIINEEVLSVSGRAAASSSSSSTSGS